ncbi:MAG TPA: HAMP domain-containing sensor histidine kinase [Acidimicrobiales bacterium]|nr:HAMP domain-containing sensor histidine kinase [Acidimicrobiales bacterium]
MSGAGAATAARRGRGWPGRRRLGLRARITAGFALGALGISVVLSLITYGLTRRSVVHNRQSAAVHQTVANALVVGGAVRSSGPDLTQVLSSLSTPNGSESLLYQRGSWVSTNLALGSAAVPAALRATVLRDGQPATMAYRLAGHAELAVGVPLPGSGKAGRTAYFELYDFSDLTRTLTALALSLGAASVATTLAGMAVGRWASRRVLSPLAETARAAAAIAGGRLDTRLQAGDDSELADLADSFNSMVTALQGRIQRDARFASDVSHELRSPLTTLRNAVDVLQRRRPELSERSAQALDLLTEEVTRFGRLVEDLLEVSRFDAGAADLLLEEIRPAELVRHALAARGPAGVELVVEPGTPAVRADKRRLERVLSNLLANADVHGDGATRVVVGPVHGPDRAAPPAAFIAVDDAGPGVPPEERETIFERFARGRAAGRRARGEGVGLGLSLVAEHVRLMGGSVRVTDSPDGGARFLVALPAASGTGADSDPDGREGRGLPRGLGEDPRGSRPPEAAEGRSRASALGAPAARGTAGTR